jgi:K+-sensing histidine kinase KdpD
MSEASSLTGRKRERAARSPTTGGFGAPGASNFGRLSAVHDACRQLRRPYQIALNEIAVALERIFSARLVVLRDSGPGEPLGLAPAGIDPRDWLDTLEGLRRNGGDGSPQIFSVPAAEAWPRASGIEQFVVVPLEQPHGRGSLWLGFTERLTLTSDDLTCFALVGERVAFSLWQLSVAATQEGANACTRGAPDLSTQEIVSIAAHELRTPLTPITMLLQALERKARTGQFDVEAIARTRRQVNRLAQMISDLLDLTRLREGRLVLTPVLLELGSCLTQAVTAFRESDPKRRVELTMTGEPMVILSDEQRFLQATASLLEHVARMTPADSIIQVNIERRSDRAAVTMTAERPHLAPDVPANPTRANHRTTPFALSVLVAQAVLTRFGGTISVTGPQHSDASVEATFPLNATDAD